MLKALFSWLDAYPLFYWSLALAVTGWAITLAWRATWCAPGRGTNGAWLDAAIVAALFAWRWPFLLAAHQLTPDEAQQIAGAITLAHDPVFWRSVDGATAGPLDFYVLLLPHLVGAPLDFFFARLVGLLLVASSLVILRRTLAHEAGPSALPATLAATLMFALSTDWEFIHYSTEHVPIFLSTAAAALWWRTRPGSTGHTLLRWVAAGFVAGLLPWAKLQAAPFVVLFAGGACWLALLRGSVSWKTSATELACYAVGLAMPTMLAVGCLAQQHVWSDFWFSYIARNFQYADQGWDLSFVLREFGRLTTPLRIFPAFLIACGGLLLVGLATTAMRRQRPSTFGVATALLAATAVLVVVSPRRGFPHYLLFSIIPLAALAGAALGTAADSRHRALRWATLGALFAAPLALVAVRATLPPPFMIGQLSDHWRHPYGSLASRIRQVTHSGDTIAVWGWSTEIYVHSQLPQAVRDAHSQRQIETGPWQHYYRQRYLSDFCRNRPAVFIDAVGNGAFAYQDRGEFGHETFPELAALIRADYVQVADDIHARLYVRRDRVEPASPKL